MYIRDLKRGREVQWVAISLEIQFHYIYVVKLPKVGIEHAPPPLKKKFPRNPQPLRGFLDPCTM